MDDASSDISMTDVNHGTDSNTNGGPGTSVSDSILEPNQIPPLDISKLINSMKAESKVKKSGEKFQGSIFYTLSQSKTVLFVLPYRAKDITEIVVIRVCTNSLPGNDLSYLT